MEKQVSSKNTKAQILEAYNQLYEQYAQLQVEHTKSLQERKALESKITQGAVAQPPRSAQPQATTHQYTLNDIVNGLATLRAGFGNAISELSAMLTTEVARLETLRHQMESRTKQLTELYGLTVTDDTLNSLIQEYRQKAQAFAQEAKLKRETFERERDTAQKAWRVEQEDHARLTKERDRVLKTERRREEQAYNYGLELQRQLDQETYEQKEGKRHEELETFVKEKQTEWAARENALATQEEQYRELKARISAFPKDLETAVRRAEKEGTDLARRKAKERDDLLTKEEEGSRRRTFRRD